MTNPRLLFRIGESVIARDLHQALPFVQVMNDDVDGGIAYTKTNSI
jgi:hypothetical protein